MTTTNMNEITATVAELNRRHARETQRVANYMSDITDAIAQGGNTGRIAEVLVTAAEAEGYLKAITLARMVMAHPDGTVEAARQTLTATMLHGSDDSWSGRGNDVRRARHDGFLKGVRDLFEIVL